MISRPYYHDEKAGITIHHADCREILPGLPMADLLLTDPPYGIKAKTNNSRFSGGSRGKRGRKLPGTGGGSPIAGDAESFDPSFLLRYGSSHIIWGWNHYPNALPRGACLVWIKRNDQAFGSFLSDAELAWMSKGHGVYCRRDLSNNAIARKRVHPTQKPLGLMHWCLSFFPWAGLIIDPYMGSGTTLLAAKLEGRRAIGIELEEKFCEAAATRLSREVQE